MHLRRQLLLPNDDDLSYHNHSDIVAPCVAPAKVGFICFIEKFNQNSMVDSKLLYYGEYGDDQKQSNDKKTPTRINHPALGMDHAFVGTCNGLICLSERIKSKSWIEDPVYICNPITRECISLPAFISDNNHSSSRMVSGFGYSISTNEYKVVRIYYDDALAGKVGRVQIYTLGGGGGWRNKGEITNWYFKNTIPHTRGVFVNGALHWLEMIHGNIVAFDFVDEKFHVLPSPPCSLRRTYGTDLTVLGGCLCLLHGPEIERNVTDIWSFKKKASCYDETKEEK